MPSILHCILEKVIHCSKNISSNIDYVITSPFVKDKLTLTENHEYIFTILLQFNVADIGHLINTVSL